MTEFYAFAAEHPWLALFLMICVLNGFAVPFKFAGFFWNRYLRSKNIAARGWPPAHLDADGDFKPEQAE